VEGVVDAIWFNQGQVCCAGSRLLVQEGIADRLYDKLRARMETLRLGSPLDKAVDMGAIVAPVQLERIRTLVEQGKQEGADFWQPTWACPTEGCFYPPTLFTNVTPSSTIAQVEIFGPVLVAMTFRTPSEAVALANNTPYGLAASVWSESINLALDVAPKIKAGVVWINSTNLFDAAAGFGGYRESGFGREGGREGMFEYLKKDGRTGGPEDRRTEKANGKRRSGHAVARSSGQAGKSAKSSHRAAELDDVDRGPKLDRTAKMYIGGKQARPDSGYSIRITGHDGRLLGEVGEGNRKDTATRSRRHTPRLVDGPSPPGTRVRRSSTTSPRISWRGATNSRVAWVRSPVAMEKSKWTHASSGCSPTARGPTSTMARCTRCRCAASRWR